MFVGFAPMFVLLGQAKQLRLERGLRAFSMAAQAPMARDCQLLGLCITNLVIRRIVFDDLD